MSGTVRCLSLLLLVQVLLSAAVSHHHRQTERWSDAAFSWLERECHGCVRHRSQARLYIARPNHKGRLRAVSADGGSRHAGLHDSVLVIDPHPEKPYGHPIHMFFVDLNVSRQHCESRAGLILDGGECLSEWRRPRCPRRSRHGCSLTVPPEVRLSRAGPDLLLCSDRWSACPESRSGPAAGGGACDPLVTNGKGCRAALASPCVFMRTCHNAVILSGGWNKQLANEDSFKNVRKINNMLKKNGFAGSNIQIFFANGLSKNEEGLYSNELGNVYPSSLKFAFRYHLKSLCEIKHCSNTLFIYLNSPTLPDGTSLLWDTSGNGEFDESEVYTVKELLSDIGNCKSKRVVLVVDQSYPGELLKGLRKHSGAFQNLVVLTTEEEGGGKLVDKLEGITPSTCLSGLGLGNTTLSGTPCDEDQSDEPPPTCQNLSTFEMLEPEQAIDLA